MQIYPTLNFPACDLTLIEQDNITKVYDIVRKIYVVLSPEEWVRQHTLHYFINMLHYPINYFAVEKEVKYNNLLRRYDVLIYDKTLKPMLVIECKAPEVKISQSAFNQIAMYNKPLKAPLLFVTNGLIHFCCNFNIDKNKYDFIKTMPAYEN